MKTNILCAVGVAAGLLACPASVAQTDKGQTPDDGPSRLGFPVIIEAPTIVGGQNIKDGEALYEQVVQSPKAVRLAQAHTFKYSPRTLDRVNVGGGETAITLAAGTILVVADDKSGEMYCTAASEGKDSWVTFYDVGYCLRDTDNDGIFDKEIVIEQTPWRVRVAYEILGTGAGVWKDIKLPYERLEVSQIPEIRFRLSYHYTIRRSGLFGTVKTPSAYYSCHLVWPATLALSTPHENSGSGAAFADVGNLNCSQIADSRTQFAGNEISPKGQTKVTALPFAFSLTGNADNSVNAEFESTLPPGMAVLIVAGREWNRSDFRFQVTIVRVLLPR